MREGKRIPNGKLTINSLLTFHLTRIFLFLSSCSRAVHSPNPSPSTGVNSTEDRRLTEISRFIYSHEGRVQGLRRPTM